MGDGVGTAASPVSRLCLLAWKDMQPLCSSVGDLPFLLIPSGPMALFLWGVLIIVPISWCFAPSLFSKYELERLSTAALSFSFLLRMPWSGHECSLKAPHLSCQCHISSSCVSLLLVSGAVVHQLFWSSCMCTTQTCSFQSYSNW